MPQEPAFRIAFVDLETTGLDPRRHEPWEIAVIVEDVFPDGTHRPAIQGAHEVQYPKPRRLGGADSIALGIGGYYTRTFRGVPSGRFPTDPEKLAADLTLQITPGTYLAGCTIHFDAAFLDVFMRENGQCPMWNYHLIDCTTYAAGRMQLTPPWKSTTLFEAYGIEVDEAQAHTALYDAQMAQKLFWAAHDLVAA
jgi:DNA polymerase III epsilon subunit-like protein